MITALGASGEKTRPPNFLILFTDDISASHLGCYGSRNPDTTPNIDRLAEEGIRFEKSFKGALSAG